MTAQPATTRLQCARTFEGNECLFAAMYRVGFRVWPSRLNYPEAEPFVGRLELWVCVEHRATVGLDDVLDASARTQMEAEVRRRNPRNPWRSAPDWSTAELAFFPIEVS